MRLKLTLAPLERKCTIPINYQYPVSAWIYKILEFADKGYANWLHQHGYGGVSESDRLYKFFVFSKISIPRVKQHEDVLTVLDFSPCSLYVSSVMEEFIHHFIRGLFKNNRVSIGNHRVCGKFKVDDLEILSDPKWEKLGDLKNKGVVCKSLSPIVVSCPSPSKGRPSHYLRPDEEGMSDAIARNLLRKFQVWTGVPPPDDSFQFKIDQEYVEKRGGWEKISKMVSIRENEQKTNIKVKAFIAPFELFGTPELIRCAYGCGIGEKNSLGFGMFDLADALPQAAFKRENLESSEKPGTKFTYILSMML